MASPLEEWVEDQARLAEPDRIYWCDGSDGEAERLLEIGMSEEKINGQPVFSRLNHKTWPTAYLPPEPSLGCRPDRAPDLCLSFQPGYGGPE